MVTVGMNYQVLPGKEEVFERAFKQVLTALQEAPGHNESHLYRDIDAPATYLIVSDWNDQTAFDTFIRSPEFARVTSWGKEQILAGRPKHRVYRSDA
jgi:heme-degrading monooxygenase HmoA